MTDAGKCQNKNDEELIILTLKDQEYFSCIIKRYKYKLYNYIRRISSASEEDAEDILQEVFMKTYFNLNDFNADLKFSSWIYRIARNQAISQYRKTKARPEGYAVNLGDEIIKNLTSGLDIAKDLDLKILRKNIFKIFNNLDKKHKEVLVLKFFEEKDYSEISDIIKRPMGTVASLISKAKLEFKKEFKKQFIKFKIRL